MVTNGILQFSTPTKKTCHSHLQLQWETQKARIRGWDKKDLPEIAMTEEKEE